MPHSRDIRPQEVHGRSLLDRYAARKKRAGEPVFCVQLGANDGVVSDPVHRYIAGHGWSGLLVEPQVDVFSGPLTRTYAGNPSVRLANVAVAPADGEMPFYRVAISDERWATGLSSFRRESIQAHIDNGYIASKAAASGIEMPADPADIISQTRVRCLTFNTLLEEHDISRIDALFMDVEGFECEIFKLFDLEKYQPELVFFESDLLDVDDYADLLDRLRASGYSLYWSAGDTIATKQPVSAAARALAYAAYLAAGVGRKARPLLRTRSPHAESTGPSS